MRVKRFIGCAMILGVCAIVYRVADRSSESDMSVWPLSWLTDCLAEFEDCGMFGHVSGGVFKEADETPIWTITCSADLDDADPVIYLYGQIERSTTDFSSGVPQTITAFIVRFDAEHKPIDSGVAITMQLVATRSQRLTYRSQKAFIFIDNPQFVGDRGTFIAIQGCDGGSTKIVLD